MLLSQALIDFRWTLDELNVATFAQESKTPKPIFNSTRGKNVESIGLLKMREKLIVKLS